jgi:hypothetical protein
MSEHNTVKVGDWIEREVAFGYCRWAKVTAVSDPVTVSVVYLDGETPVEEEMILEDSNWKFKSAGVDGFKAGTSWFKILQEGPPSRILGTNQLVYEESKDAVWLRMKTKGR